MVKRVPHGFWQVVTEFMYVKIATFAAIARLMDGKLTMEAIVFACHVKFAQGMLVERRRTKSISRGLDACVHFEA